jgi:hypothetical protein
MNGWSSSEKVKVNHHQGKKMVMQQGVKNSATSNCYDGQLLSEKFGVWGRV